LYLEADDVQERFFAGPDRAPGKLVLYHEQDFYTNMTRFIYNDGFLKGRPVSPKAALVYVDIFNEGLATEFFQPILILKTAELSDGDPRLVDGWGAIEEANGEKYRVISEEALLKTSVIAEGKLLLRVKMGTSAVSRTDKSTDVILSVASTVHKDAVCMPRWINWLLPEQADSSTLGIHVESPVRVYAVEVYRQKN